VPFSALPEEVKVALDSLSDEALDQIDYVEWTLHPTFPNPIRKTRNRSEKYRIETGGWGVFQIGARVQTKDGSSVRLRHSLSLHYPDGRETVA
jgi:transcription initiation factor IIF auxiliary subunit